MKKIEVAIIVGSDSDLPLVDETAKVLKEFAVEYSVNVASAHRTPEHVREIIRQSEKDGAKIFIAAAGMAAALPGVVAAETNLPVIGIPVESKPLGGLDALFSIVQMPPGIPVAAVAIGKAGAVNAGILAAKILALGNRELDVKLGDYRKKLAQSVMKKDADLQNMGIEKYIAGLKNLKK